MAYIKTAWLDRDDPLFDSGTSPEVDADNLNKIENGIAGAYQALANLSSCYGVISSSTQQAIYTSNQDLSWEIETLETDSAIFEFNDTANTITIKKAGIYNIIDDTTFGVGTALPTTVTVDIVDSVVGTVWHTQDSIIEAEIGDIKNIIVSKQLKFTSGEVPVTLKIIHRASWNNIYINGFSYAFNTLASASTLTDHSILSGRSDADAHPIQAITGLSEKLNGSLVSGEAL